MFCCQMTCKHATMIYLPFIGVILFVQISVMILTEKNENGAENNSSASVKNLRLLKKF